MERLFGIDVQLLFDAGILALNMLVLFTALSYFLLNPVKNVLKKRQDRITNDIELAVADKEEADSLKKEYEGKIKDIQKEAEIILRDARKRGQKNEEKIVDEARQEAVRIINHAKAEAELEKKKAVDDIKKEIIKVATLMAGKVVAVSVDESTQDALVEETLKAIGDNTWLN